MAHDRNRALLCPLPHGRGADGPRRGESRRGHLRPGDLPLPQRARRQGELRHQGLRRLLERGGVLLRQQDRDLGLGARFRPQGDAQLAQERGHARVHAHRPDPDLPEIREEDSRHLPPVAPVRIGAPSRCPVRISERYRLVPPLGGRRAEPVCRGGRPVIPGREGDASRGPPPRRIPRMYALDNDMLTWNEMSVFGKTSLGNESSYNAGFAFVRYIGEKYGDDKLEAISRNLSSLTAVTIDGAIGSAVGKNGSDLYDEWKEELRKEYAARTAPLKGALVEGKVVGNVGFGNFYPSFSPDGKRDR